MTATNTQEPVYQTDALIAEDIDKYLEVHQHKTMLRFITCGSVDDGKSTLIGRLLHDAGAVPDDLHVPVPALTASLAITPATTLDAFVQLGFRASALPGCGSVPLSRCASAARLAACACRRESSRTRSATANRSAVISSRRSNATWRPRKATAALVVASNAGPASWGVARRAVTVSPPPASIRTR